MAQTKQNPFTDKPWHCGYPAPARCWYQLPSGGWTSREWRGGEKATYEREVLGREPS